MAAEILAQGKEMQRYMNEKVNEIVAGKEEAFSKARTFMLEVSSVMLEKNLFFSVLLNLSKSFNFNISV